MPRAPRFRLSVLCALVAGVAMAHAALYATTTPPWHLFDEEQHVDYTLSLRDRRLPELTDYIQQGIIDSAAANHRWSTLHLPQPASTRVEDLGLEGRSYEAYQPPLYYAVGVVAILPAGHDAALAMALLRALSVVLAGCVAALVVVVSWQALGAPPRAPFGIATGGFLVALLPSFAQAGGRASNDIAVTAAVVATAAAALAWTRTGQMRHAVLVGTAGAAAGLTKSSGIVVLPIVVLAALACRRKDSSFVQSLVAVAIPIGAAALWAAITWSRYGVLEGSRAFIDFARFRPHPWSQLARSARLDALGPTLLMESERNGAGPWSLAVWASAISPAMVGAARAWGSRRLVLAFVAVVIAGAVMVTVVAFSEGLEVAVMSRLALPAIAMVAALVGIGATRRSGNWLGAGVVLSAAAMAAWYFARV